MTTYKGINGFAVQSVGSDPSPLDEGQVWYNNATYAFKVAAATTVGTWAAGGNLNSGKANLAGAGTQTAAVAFGGNPYSASELYNGTSWTTTGSLNTNRQAIGGAGTQTSALGFGGYTGGASGATEKFNGSTWTSNPTGLNTARYRPGGAGSSNTAVLAFGGLISDPVGTTSTETYNGTSWTNVNSLNTARGALAGVGTQTSALAFGGFPTPNRPATESWNGTSWTTVNSLNTGRNTLAGAGSSNVSALAFGGNSGSATGATELWNGTSWTSNPNSMATVRDSLGGCGTQTSALGFGGGNPVVVNTEEWTGPGAPLTQTITTS
jgi:hypothetical protein